MKYLRNLLLMLLILLFPATFSFAQSQFSIIFPYVNLGEVKGSYSTNNVVCAKQSNNALLYLTPQLVASGNNWRLGSIEPKFCSPLRVQTLHNQKRKGINYCFSLILASRFSWQEKISQKHV